MMLCVIPVWRNLVDACGLKPHLFGIGSSPITGNYIIIKDISALKGCLRFKKIR